MQSLRGIGSKKKENNNEVGAWSLVAWRSGEARLLYGSSQSDNHSQQRGPTHHNPTPPYPPPGTTAVWQSQSGPAQAHYIDKRGRTSGSSRGQVVVEGPLLHRAAFQPHSKALLRGTAQADPFVRPLRLRVMKICMLSIDCMMDGLDVECPLSCMFISITGPLSLILLERARDLCTGLAG